MLFNSIEFVLFFVIVVVAYYLLPNNRVRKVFLLLASYYFYASWNVAFLGILLVVTLVSYGFGIFFERRRKKLALWGAIVLLLLPLLTFKYLDFFLSSLSDVLDMCGLKLSVPEFHLLLPVGISFFTFMALGYVIDVYKQKIGAEKDLLDYALFIGFFPQIASGPIGRAGQLIPQLKEKKLLQYDNLAAGAKLMLWGFFLKLVVGDRAGIYVNTVFGNVVHHNGTSLLLATFFYTIQIYCDFGGYSLIAIGTAKTMGYNLMENFRRPYFATSVGDFWRRWHISLSTWFRDYVYIPCGGSRVGALKLYRNLLITFLVSGLWHGAAYNFVLWGGYHAINQIFGKMLKPIKDKCRAVLHIGDESLARKLFDILATFCLVSYGWMLFYAPDLQFVVDVTRGYFNLGSPYIHQTTVFFFVIGLVIMFVKDFRDEFFPQHFLLMENRHVAVRYCTFALLAVLVVMIGVFGGSQFIYFKF